MIRPARPDDADALRALVEAAYGHYVPGVGRPPGPMLDDYARRIAAGQAWILEEHGKPVGVPVLEEAGDDALRLDNVAVASAAQRRGHGQALIAFAAAEARRRGCRELRLYTHVLVQENRALYARLSFQETGRATEKGYKRVYMARALD